MSTRVLGTGSEEYEPYTSLEYLVSPVQKADRPDTEQKISNGLAEVRADFGNCLQSLTNLAYLLSRDGMDEAERRTTMTLMQAQLAHLTVLAKQCGAVMQPLK